MKILVLILISTLYLNCVANAETLMPIGFKGKWGFVSEYGKLVITPQFDDAGDFYEGLAPIKVKDKQGFINQKGNIVIKPKYDNVFNFSEGLAIIVLNKKYGFITKKGIIAIPAQYDGALSFKNGFGAVKVNDKWGYIDKNGKLLFEPQFDNLHLFGGDGLAAAAKGEVGYIVKNNGTIIFESNKELSNCNEGLIQYESDKKWGCTDLQGKVIIPAKFSGGIHFKDGLAVVPENSKWAVIDTTGNYVAKPIYQTS
jgi:hypothetical protein